MGRHYEQKILFAERQIAAAEERTRRELGLEQIKRLPGHLVEVVDMGMMTALEVDERLIYCWCARAPGNVYPVPFNRVLVPFVLVPGPMPI